MLWVKALLPAVETCNYGGEPANGHLCSHWKDNKICPMNKDDSEEQQKGNSIYVARYQLSMAA